MGRASKFVVVMLVMLTLLAGCKKKKPPLPPAAEQAPSLGTPTAVPEPQPQAQPTPPPAPIPAAVQPPPSAATTLKRKTRKTVARKPAPKPEVPEKKITVVDSGSVQGNGSAPGNAQLAAELPAAEAMQQRQSTAQLRAFTEAGLHGLTRTLSSDEQAMVQQIRAYLQQSRAAEADGDTERAHNLAFKANLLSRELAKR